MPRSLEVGSLVTSEWDTERPGPARRIYSLTPDGVVILDRWVIDLRETDRVLHYFLRIYDKSE